MGKLYKKGLTQKEVKSKEGQRNFLYSNKGVNRCPSLGFDINSKNIPEEIRINHLAGILVRIFLSQKSHEQRNTNRE